MSYISQSEPRLLGRGRSASVYSGRDDRGRSIVHKVFRGDPASKVVLFLLTGSANPYTWCEAAIRSAYIRRQLLSLLVGYWFGKDRRLRLPRTDGWSWNATHRAFELRCELVDGCHLPLRGPGEPHDPDSPDLMSNLRSEIMRPLQRHLVDSGFDGLAWQAGRGNPVAGGNFMLERPNAEHRPASWVWIDLESGVPALFALDPLATLGFYLPKSVHHRRWLFDDVDTEKLEDYLREHRSRIEGALGRPAFTELEHLTKELDVRQEEWKAISRTGRSVAYQLSQGRIRVEEADYYCHHPWRWQLRLAKLTAKRAGGKLMGAVHRGLRWLRNLDLERSLTGLWRFLTSQRFRALMARRFVAGRIAAWTRRRFLTRDELRRLRRQLRHDDASAYLTDFIVHLMMKPLIKSLQWFAIPSMVALGWLDMASAAIFLVVGGSLGRTLYTSGRFLQSIKARQRRPWVALVVGFLPVVGNSAYPAQLLYSGTEKTSDLARFILLDAAAAIGRAVPIWGGTDSLVEHVGNRIGYVAIGWLSKADVRDLPLSEHPLKPTISP